MSKRKSKPKKEADDTAKTIAVTTASGLILYLIEKLLDRLIGW